MCWEFPCTSERCAGNSCAPVGEDERADNVRTLQQELLTASCGNRQRKLHGHVMSAAEEALLGCSICRNCPHPTQHKRLKEVSEKKGKRIAYSNKVTSSTK
ncbi:hypothetical protein FKM82_014541 [Ascaphus truei]